MTLKIREVIKALHLEEDKNSRSNSSKVVSEDRHPGRDRKPSQLNTENTWRGHNNPNTSNRPLSCYICNELYQAKECPNKLVFYAFQASLASDSNDKLSQSGKEIGQVEEVENPRVGAMRFLSSLQKKVGETSKRVKGGLIYVDT